jgi:predicted nucleic acid-binding protein
MRIFLDTNIFVYFLTCSSKSEKAKELLDYLVDRGYELVTSINVVEEVLFILTRELLRNKRISGKENMAVWNFIMKALEKTDCLNLVVF